MFKRVAASVGIALVLACGVALVYFALFSPYKLYVVHTGSMGQTIPSRSSVVVHTGQYHVGQPVTFTIHGEKVTHRLLAIDANGAITTKGDANRSADPWHPPKQNIIGGVVLAPRYLGWILVFLRQPTGLLGLCLISLGVWTLWNSDPETPAATNVAPSA